MVRYLCRPGVAVVAELPYGRAVQRPRALRKLLAKDPAIRGGVGTRILVFCRETALEYELFVAPRLILLVGLVT